MKLWLDDVRPPPGNGWTWVKTVSEARDLLSLGVVDDASLDHDLNDFDYTVAYEDVDGEIRGVKEWTGYDLVVWMMTTGYWPNRSCLVHSMNPCGAANMRAVISANFEIVV